MTDRQLMQQALEMIGQLKPDNWHDRDRQGQVWDALRERLAQPEQEPVAWADEIIDDLHAQYNTDGIKEIDSGDALIRLDEAIAAVEEAEKRHTAPPQRKPLPPQSPCEMTQAEGKMFKLGWLECEAAHGIKGEA